MNANGPGVPDLLRRFTPTPHSVHVSFRQFEISLQTNDAELAVAMELAGEPRTNDRQGLLLLARIIRDYEAPEDSSQLTLLSHGPLLTLVLGTGTMLTMDCGRRELMGFLAPAVPTQRVLDELLPLLLDRLSDAAASTNRTQMQTHR